MRGNIVIILILTSSLFLSINTASKIHQSTIQPNQSTQLVFNQTVYQTISSGHQDYEFTLDQYTNVTITIVTGGNLTISIPYHQNMYTNYGNLTQSQYLAASNNVYYVHVYPEQGFSRDYTLTLSNGNPVVDSNNHSTNKLFPMQPNQVVTHVLNYTGNFETNYYEVNIPQNGTYRFNINYNLIRSQSYPVYFELNQSNTISRCHVFDVANITQSLVVTLIAGNYTLIVLRNQNSFAVPWEYKLWYTTQYELQGPSDVGINDEMYGFISNSSVDVYHFSAKTDEVIWFLGFDKEILVSITGFETQKQVGVYSDIKSIYSNSNMTYTPAGNYTLTVMTTSSMFHDYVLEIHRIEPDILENGTNSKNNPYPVTPDYFTQSFSLHVPYDVDWFSITVPSPSLVSFPNQDNTTITVFNGTDIVPLTPDGPHWLMFNSSAATYTVEISTSSYVEQYYMIWEYGVAGTTNTYRAVPSTVTASSRLKIGYPILNSMILMAIPVIILTRLRKR